MSFQGKCRTCGADITMYRYPGSGRWRPMDGTESALVPHRCAVQPDGAEFGRDCDGCGAPLTIRREGGAWHVLERGSGNFHVCPRKTSRVAGQGEVRRPVVVSKPARRRAVEADPEPRTLTAPDGFEDDLPW